MNLSTSADSLDPAASLRIFFRPVDRRAALPSPARRVADHALLRHRLGRRRAACGAARLQESNGDEFRSGSQSVSQTSDHPIPRRAS
jgi:hypothetical protein